MPVDRRQGRPADRAEIARAGYRGRLAPSPTGEVHLGIARTSLIAWLAARAASGTLVLRIEDIDTPRVVAGSAEAIMEQLRWLGLDWDEGPDVGGPHAPYAQSARTALYEEAIERLRARGVVYPCTCSRKEIASLASAPHGDLGPRYPGTCRHGPSHPRRPEALRFAMPAAAPGFSDRVHGPQAAGPSDDFVLRRADGVYAYQLAVVVDDLAMGITEVVRGDDLLSSTPRQLALYAALGATPPTFLHVPLVLDDQGRRMSKRFGSPGVPELRAAGMSPDQVIGKLAFSLGLTADDSPLTAAELVPHYDPDKLAKSPSVLSVSV